MPRPRHEKLPKAPVAVGESPPGTLYFPTAEPPETEVSEPREVPEVEPGLLERRAWPPTPKRLSFAEFEDHIKLWTDEMWSHTSIYLYRSWPIINRKLSDETNPKYIDLISSPKEATRDYILRVHGGGKYQLWLSDSDRRGVICTIPLSIGIDEAAPKVRYDELVVGHPDNKGFIDYEVRNGRMTTDGAPAMPTNSTSGSDVATALQMTQTMLNRVLDANTRAQQQNPTAMDAIYAKSMEENLKMAREAYHQALQQVQAGNNRSAIDELTKVMDLVSKFASRGEATEGSGKLIDRLLTLEAENRKSTELWASKFIDLLREQQSERSKPPSTQLDELLKIKEVAEAFGMTGGGSKRGSTLETVLEHLPRVLDPIARLAMSIASAKTGQSIPSPVVYPTAPPAPALPNPTTPQTEVNQSDMQLVSILSQAQDRIVTALYDDEHGADFANAVVGMYGIAVHSAIKSYGKEKVLATIKGMPQFYARISNMEEKLSKFLDDFLGFPETLPADEEE